MSTKKHATGTGCKALNRLEWECDLGYPIAALKKFKPLLKCPKPTTDEELEGAPRHG